MRHRGELGPPAGLPIQEEEVAVKTRIGPRRRRNIGRMELSGGEGWVVTCKKKKGMSLNEDHGEGVIRICTRNVGHDPMAPLAVLLVDTARRVRIGLDWQVKMGWLVSIDKFSWGKISRSKISHHHKGVVRTRIIGEESDLRLLGGVSNLQ